MLNPDEQKQLLQLAKQSISLAFINNGQDNGQELINDINQYSNNLQAHRASFVTLNIHQQLRGCIGRLSAQQPLVLDVIHNAYAAAFSDSRFPPLTQNEFPLLQYHISILSPSSPIAFSSYEDLLEQIRPQIDGLILSEGNYQATFLPSVWEQISDKALFIKHLLNKAGLASDYWSEKIQISRYTVESVE